MPYIVFCPISEFQILCSRLHILLLHSLSCGHKKQPGHKSGTEVSHVLSSSESRAGKWLLLFFSKRTQGSFACKEQEQVQTVTEATVLDIFTQADSVFSGNHTFDVLLLLSNGSHIYIHFWISLASRRPPGKPASSFHRGQSRRLYFVAHMKRTGVTVCESCA